MNGFKTFVLAGIAAIALASTPASAATLLYSFSSSSGIDDFSFSLDSNPTPNSFDPGFASSFDFFGFPVTTKAGAGTVILSFSSSSIFDELALIGPSYVYNFSGPQLYSGPDSSPTMLTGTFALTGFYNELSGDPEPVAGTLNVTEVSAAVPEPSTWAMMLLGFGAVGFSMRKARQAKAVLQAA